MVFSHELLRPGVRQQCESCHRKPSDKLHQKIVGDCQACHRQEAWKPATFDHAKLFVLDRDHDAECSTCHKGNDYSAYTCYGCHEHTAVVVNGETLVFAKVAGRMGAKLSVCLPQEAPLEEAQVLARDLRGAK